jgi:DNA polymerase-3 subunit alpha
VIPFETIPKEVWIKYPNKEDFVKDEQSLYQILSQSDGEDSVIIYLEYEKAIKHLPKSKNINAEVEFINKLKEKYGTGNIQVIEKSIEKALRMH